MAPEYCRQQLHQPSAAAGSDAAATYACLPLCAIAITDDRDLYLCRL
jgi:hypothetical protein